MLDVEDQKFEGREAVDFSVSGSDTYWSSSAKIEAKYQSKCVVIVGSEADNDADHTELHINVVCRLFIALLMMLNERRRR